MNHGGSMHEHLEYKVIEASTVERLNQRVSDFIKTHDWRPVGGVAMQRDPNNVVMRYCQAIVSPRTWAKMHPPPMSNAALERRETAEAPYP